jgi:hypothetical protein
MFPPFPTTILGPLPSAIDPTTADAVRIRRIVSELSGQAGAKKTNYSAWSDPVPCLIKGVRSVDTTGPQLIEHAISTYQVTFADYPNVGVRDQLSWDALSKVLNVVGVYPIGDSTTREWIVMAEEHP